MALFCNSEVGSPARGCTSTMLCISALNDTMDSAPAYVAKSYVTPQKMKQQLRKRQSKQQTYVKTKNSKLDNVPEFNNNNYHEHSSMGYGLQLVPNTIIQGHAVPLDLRNHHTPSLPALPPPSAPPEQHSSGGLGTSTNPNKCDTLKLSKVRRLQSISKAQEKRRSLMESHFGAHSSLQAKAAFVRAADAGGLLRAQPAVFRSSSTACISPVKKTESIPSPPAYFAGHINNNGVRSYNPFSENYHGNAVSIYNNNKRVNPFTANSNLNVIYNVNDEFDADDQPRRRSKSFSSSEMLSGLSLSKSEEHHLSNIDLSPSKASRLPTPIYANTVANSLITPDHSPVSSDARSDSSITVSSNNNNNVNILKETTNIQPECAKKKLKAARGKLKSTKALSKSLHSIFPIGCTGSLTLQHEGLIAQADGEPLYQSISQFETQYQKVDHQMTAFQPLSDGVQFTPKAHRRKIHSLKSYAKRKNTQSESTASPSDTTLDSLASANIDNNTNIINRSKSKSLKSLSKAHFFSCVATKDLWYNKLAQVIAEEKESTPPNTNIQVSYYDTNTCADICKTVNITSNTNARECITIILDSLEMRDADVTKFQLWVKSSQDDAPYPLIGHEFPFAIKQSCVTQTSPSQQDADVNNVYSSADVKCHFILRQERKLGITGLTPVNGGKKVSKKARKSPIRIHKVFKRSNSKGDSLDGGAPSPPGILFGHPLHKLFEANGSGLPKPIMDMLSQLFQKGPFTLGIFRKSANVRTVRELREKLDSGCPTDLNSANITAVAALFKEFLRSLPDALLCSQFYDEWLEIPRLPTSRDQISQTLLLCSKLPRANLILLQHFLCILHHIARRSSSNMMSPSNLAVCVGPSLLWPSSPAIALCPETSKQAPSVMEFLIERFGEIFGEAMLRLMGEAPEQDPARQDSGAEESDSLHSGHSLHSCNGRRDDSSIDSLERDLEGELSPLPRKDKMSLTNLSRDSGLTMSDTQLYTPDEEESESTSSGHSSGDKNVNYSDHRPLERVQHYPAPNNPNAIYTAVCRRPEKMIVYDDSENYYATPSKEHARVQITYSSPGYSTVMGNGDYNGYPYSNKERQDNSMCNEEDSIYSVPSTEGASCNFQRDNWMRRKSNLRKVSKTNSGDGSLVRSNSEESLLNKYNNHEYGSSLCAGGAISGRLSPSEDRRGSPATIEYDDDIDVLTRDSAIRRSRSAHYLAEIKQERLKDHSADSSTSIARSSSQDTVTWLRSRSTPHIQDEGDRSYDSSTLSDDDSTPHVSRSNSRGKECGTNGMISWDATLSPSDSGNSRNSSFKSERTGSVCTVVSAGSCSTLSSNPPSYEEALNRRTIMQQQQKRTGTPPHYNEYAIQEEKIKSARAKQLYADSLRMYQQEEKVYCDIVRASPAHAGDELDCPPPLPPKGDPPPLPPKQRLGRRSNNDTNRLKHLPPVHVETQGRKPKGSNSGSGFGPTMHKTIIYTDVCPPNLPPKEQRTVIEVLDEDRNKSKTPVRTTPSHVVEKKSIETQTDDFELEDEDYRDNDSPSSEPWLSDHITSVHVPDNTYNNTKRSRGRPRRRDSSTSQRSRSVPSRDSNNVLHSESESDDDNEDDWDHAAFTEYAGAAAHYGLGNFGNLDSELRHEITWSVPQLRARFDESLKRANAHPPPYRPPPLATGRAPITSYHLGAGDTFSRKSRPQTQYGEESYV